MENIKLNFALVCDYAFFSDKSKLNIIGIFQSIIQSQFPHTHQQMFVVTNVSFKEDRTYVQKIRLIKSDTNTDIMTPLEFKADVKKPPNKTKAELGIVAQLNAVKFPQAGEYKFLIEIDGKVVEELILNVGI